MPTTTVRQPEAPAIEPGSGTGSPKTRILGIACLVGVVVLFVFAFFLTEEDQVQGDVVRMIYVHVPVAIIEYFGFGIAAVGSVMVLWRGSMWWDTAAVAGAELGLLYSGLMIGTGVIWGRPTWNTWWEWGDARLMTSLMLFLVYLGYLAYRRTVPDAETRARRSAVIALVGIINVPIVNRSVEWWANQTLHQQSSLSDGRLEDLTLFTLAMGFVVFGMIFVWLLIHRFRFGWLERQAEMHGLEAALAERRAQRDADIDESLAHPGVSEGDDMRGGDDMGGSDDMAAGSGDVGEAADGAGQQSGDQA
ncbi:MAG: cytochrome c biogenesis protein CcsA [Actinomycetota bacterium]